MVKHVVSDRHKIKLSAQSQIILNMVKTLSKNSETMFLVFKTEAFTVTVKSNGACVQLIGVYQLID